MFTEYTEKDGGLGRQVSQLETDEEEAFLRRIYTDLPGTEVRHTFSKGGPKGLHTILTIESFFKDGQPQPVSSNAGGASQRYTRMTEKQLRTHAAERRVADSDKMRPVELITKLLELDGEAPVAPKKEPHAVAASR